MDKVFFSGSISIKMLPDSIKKSLNTIMKNDKFEILVGDASGFDFLIQEYCHKIHFNKVTVYTVNDNPRNFIEGFKILKVETPDGIKNERKRQTCKDEKMTSDSDISVVVWDEKSTGSYNNIIRALNNKKKIRVFSVISEKNIPDISLEVINRMYYNSNGMTATDLLEILYKNAIKEFDGVRHLNSYLVENNFIEKITENGKSLYKTINKKYSMDIDHRGKHSGVKLKYELAEELIEKLKNKNKKNSYGSIRG